MNRERNEYLEFVGFVLIFVMLVFCAFLAGGKNQQTTVRVDAGEALTVAPLYDDAYFAARDRVVVVDRRGREVLTVRELSDAGFETCTRANDGGYPCVYGP